jgi:hypothetical protein
MKYAFAYVLFWFIWHFDFGALPYPDYYYPGPIQDLREMCAPYSIFRNYGVKSYVVRYFDFDGEDYDGEGDPDEIPWVVGTDNYVYMCAHWDGDGEFQPVGLSLP